MASSQCCGVIAGSFVACGESVEYGYCSPECRAAAEVQAMTLSDSISYDFVTSRLAVGNVASRQAPGFCAVVSLLATAPVDERDEAPEVPDGFNARDSACGSGNCTACYGIPVLHIDINDGEGLGSPLGDGRDLADYLDDATAFIAVHIRRGCVLVHCGAGTEALSLVKQRRPGAAPADCFVAAIKRWLRLDDLESKGPRR